MTVTAEERLAAFPPAEREQREAILSTFVTLVTEKRLADLRRVRDELERLPADPAAPVGAVEPPAGEQQVLQRARTRNLLRVLADRARLREECVPAAMVREGLGVSRQRLHQLVRAHKLVVVRRQERRAGLYPAWQFTRDGGVVPGLEPVLRAAQEAEMDSETLHFFMVEPNERLEGETPAARLIQGDADPVVAVLRSAGLGPF